MARMPSAFREPAANEGSNEINEKSGSMKSLNAKIQTKQFSIIMSKTSIFNTIYITK